MPWQRKVEKFPIEELTDDELIKIEMNTRNIINPIGACGLYCRFCYFYVKCGGCRSDYNLCSLARLKEHHGLCPNVKCIKEKVMIGCWECNELLTCKKGFYAKKRVSFAKAVALFINKYGESSFLKTIKSILDTEDDHKYYILDYFFSALIGNVNSKFEVLEKCLVINQEHKDKQLELFLDG